MHTSTLDQPLHVKILISTALIGLNDIIVPVIKQRTPYIPSATLEN